MVIYINTVYYCCRSGQCRAYGLIHPVKVYGSHAEMAAATADLNHYQHGAIVLQSTDHHERGRRNATATASNAAATVGGRRNATATASDATVAVGGQRDTTAVASSTTATISSRRNGWAVATSSGSGMPDVGIVSKSTR